jgi:hypothetical protein
MFGFKKKKKLEEEIEEKLREVETIESIKKQIDALKIEKGGKMVEEETEETEEDFEEETDDEEEEEVITEPKKKKAAPKEKTIEDVAQEADVTLNQVLESFNQRLLAVEAKLFRIQSA